MIGIPLLVRILAKIFGLDFIRNQGSIEISEADRERSAPEPDVVVTDRP